MKQKQYKQCECGRIFRTSERIRCFRCEPPAGYPKVFKDSFYWQHYVVPKVGMAQAFRQFREVHT